MGAECRVCGSTDVLLQDRCAWCARFEALSLKIQEESRVAYVVAKETKDADLPLPGGLGLNLMEEQAARERLKAEGVVRVYTKNRAYTGMAYSSRLDLCDYYASNQNTELARQAEGHSTGWRSAGWMWTTSAMRLSRALKKKRPRISRTNITS